MFQHQVTIELQHTDAYGILFFANQPILCHSCLQAFLLSVGLALPPTRAAASELLVIVRVESEYHAPVQLCDVLTIAYRCEKVGTTSVVNVFTLTNQHGIHVGSVRTVHVLIDPTTSGKIPLPARWREALLANT